MNQSFIAEYNHALAPHLPFIKEEVEKKLRRLISGTGLIFHSLNGRIKSQDSIEGKLARPDRCYQNLFEITDLLGFRIVTYSEDLISEFAKLIETEFNVDFNNSINKLHHEDSQKFGYRSLHYVCSLPEYLIKNFSHLNGQFKFEIQIRTILQHAWAEIEHDTGYKTTEQLPREFRRRFSQIASLLEVADREFASIRIDLKKYEEKIKDLNFHEDSIELDKISLQSILLREELIKLDDKVSHILGIPLSETAFYPDYLLKVVRSAGLKKLSDILKASHQLSELLPSFILAYFDFTQRHWDLEKSSIREVQKGYGLLFIAHLSILNEESLMIDKVNHLTQFYNEIDYPDDSSKAKQVALSLISSLKENHFLKE